MRAYRTNRSKAALPLAGVHLLRQAANNGASTAKCETNQDSMFVLVVARLERIALRLSRFIHRFRRVGHLSDGARIARIAFQSPELAQLWHESSNGSRINSLQPPVRSFSAPGNLARELQ
jgi:hypothetical protein